MTTKTKERPILFSAPMVRAILDGRKTQTRRVVKPQPPEHAIEVFDWRAPHIAESVRASEGCYYNDLDGLHFHCKCPYGQPGDRLWVRETFHECVDEDTKEFVRWGYRADLDWDGAVWNSPIYMPRRASRITLTITDVRVERLQDISEEDAIAEGVERLATSIIKPYSRPFEVIELTHRMFFANSWDRINGQGSWDTNPWVWVVGFKKVTS